MLVNTNRPAQSSTKSSKPVLLGNCCNASEVVNSPVVGFMANDWSPLS